MIEEQTETREVSKLVFNQFSRNGFESVISKEEFDNLNEFKNYLSGKLSELLDKNYDLLIKTLYRIDVNEKKLSALFSADNKQSIPDSLADLIIERQLQKVHFRNLYKAGAL
ncbi:MAG: hypothetical protein IPM56_00345 [Ignavibacteriales bacterium]|nr:MAG: hypothetical protein IPM56_00345 [Ignavibacteriales bacterium]